LKELELLYYYCLIFLAAVILANGLKYALNLLQTLISERVLANMRKQLYQHILTLPLNFFRKTPPGTVVQALVNELVAAGDFAGTAIAIPLINVLTLLAFIGYLLWLNPLLALISMSIYPLVLIAVPLLQKRTNKANKKRVDISRTYANRITETLTGIHEVHGNSSYGIENKKHDRLVDRLFRIRMNWTLYKQSVKTTNNFFTGLSPFLIFLLGGYLAMTGRLELGALVAFLSAQERLYDPWKELIEMYQLYQDATVRYKRTMEYFEAEPEHAIKAEGRRPYKLENKIAIQGLSYVTEDGIRLLDNVTFTLNPGEQLALVGFSGSGKSTLAQCIGQLYKYTGGRVQIGDKEVSDLSKEDMAHNLGYVAQNPFIFDGTIEENLLYGCAAIQDGDGDRDGRPLPSLDEIIEVLQQTGVFVDVLRFGLNAILKPDVHQDLISVLIRVRENFQQNYGEELADYVEFFDESEYLHHSSVSENLIFGSPNQESFNDENLTRNQYFLEFLSQADLTRPLLSLGTELARQTVDILGGLPPDKVFFEQSPISPEELDEIKDLVETLKRKKLHQLSPAERDKLLLLALRFNPGRDKMVSLPQIIKQLILESRSMFREKISKDDPGAVSFFEINRYMHSQTILNNILFGKTKTARADTQDKINRSIIQLLIEEDLLETIVQIGMQFQVGSKGDRLSGGQRQKVAIARSFLKNPGILIMDEATSALDNKSQARIQNQLETRWKGKSTVLAVVHRLDITKGFDRVAVMKAGRIMEMGPYKELMDKKGMLYELVAGKK
ncbi:MAG: ABC transporter ATP-binding protein/permease, partial [Pseudomonadota bacterium]